MSGTLTRLRELVCLGDVKISEHGYDELQSDGLTVDEVVGGIEGGELLEDYPLFGKGPAVLVRQDDAKGEPIHVVWGIPRGHDGPAVLVTAYRPDPRQWSDDFRTRNP